MLRRILAGLTSAQRPATPTTVERLRLARMHFHAGEFAEASALFRMYLEHHPEDQAAQLDLALTLERLDQSIEAARTCHAAWTLAPGQHDSGQICWRLFDRLRAADLPVDANGADDLVSAFARGNSCLDAGNFDAAREHLLKCLSFDRDWPFTHQRLGCIAAHARRLDDASGHFAQSGALGVPPDAYINLGSEFLARLDPGGEETPRVGASGGPRAVVFIACDGIYFRRFVNPLVRSLCENAGTTLLLHLHIFNPDAWIEEEIAALPIGGAVARVEVSQETREFDSPDQAKTIYSCARLQVVPDVLARHGLPVVMLDADILALKSLAPLLTLADGRDVALLRWPRGIWRIWEHVCASTVVFSPSQGGLRFARLAAAYVGEFIARPGGAWYLDQIALFAALVHLQTRGLAIGEVAPDWYALYDRDGDAAPDSAVFWSVTANLAGNARALGGPMLRRFQPRLKRAFGWTLPGSDIFFADVLVRAPTEDGRRRWDHALMRHCNERLRSRRRALDIGGHVGFWSEWLAARFARVDSFEPHPLLQECFRLNVPHGNVTLHSCALGAAAGEAGMELVADNSGMSHVAPAGGTGVRVMRLDDLGFDDVDFIKIDCEGYEAAVLRGADETLRRCKPLVLIEQIDTTLERYGEAPGAALELLRASGAHELAALTDSNFLYGWPD